MAMRKEEAITILIPVVANNKNGRDAWSVPPIFVSYGLMSNSDSMGVVEQSDHSLVYGKRSSGGDILHKSYE